LHAQDQKFHETLHNHYTHAWKCLIQATVK
jgi:hypothetical protein